MKSIFTLCLLIFAYTLFPENASAQYKSVFGDSSTEWSIITQTSCRSSHSTHFRHEAKYKDSIIFFHYFKPIRVWDIDAPINNYYFLLEDTSAGKIWLYTAEDQMEHLVMDLSLAKGDTFTVKGRNDTLNFVADSIYYVNNLKHIRLTGEHTFCQKINEQFTFIEGTGTSAGLFYPNWWRNEDSINTYLLCQDKDKVKTYDNIYLLGKCLILSTNEETNGFSNLKIFPNPVNTIGMISFENNERSKVVFSIYDVAGKCLYQTQCRENQIQFSTEKFKPGIYFYKLQSQSGKNASGKFIKQILSR